MFTTCRMLFIHNAIPRLVFLRAVAAQTRAALVIYAVSKHAPPTSLIFFSASLLMYRHFTTTGWFGS